jgi:hypothetical protein
VDLFGRAAEETCDFRIGHAYFDALLQVGNVHVGPLFAVICVGSFHVCFSSEGIFDRNTSTIHLIPPLTVNKLFFD